MSEKFLVPFRKSFGSGFDKQSSIPYLIRIQIESYKELLQADILPENRRNVGIQNLFLSYFPVVNQAGNISINFIDYHIDEPRYTAQECKIRGFTYSGAIKIKLEARIFEDGSEFIKEQDLYIGDIPFMTERASFIINGSERVVVSQLHRSPGLFFDMILLDGMKNYIARIIPSRGSWLDFETHDKMQVFAFINKRKIHVTTLLMALVDDDLSKSDKEKVLDMFHTKVILRRESDFFKINLDESFINKRFSFDILLEDKISVFLYADTPIKQKHLETIKSNLYIHSSSLNGQFFYSDLFDEAGNIAIEAASMIDEKNIALISENMEFSIVDSNNRFNKYILNSLKLAKCSNKEDALLKLYPVIRPNEPIRPKLAKSILDSTFFDEERYSLSEIGRVKINQKLMLNETSFALTKDDILSVLTRLLLIANGDYKYDDPDSLSHRRVRSVGELVRNEFDQSISKMVKSIQERMVSFSRDKNIFDLVNSRYFSSAMKDFFVSSCVQLADQTNFLAELSHKRRISSFGKNGLDRARTWIEARDLHSTHYGKICAIETPEGQSVGLVNSLAIFSRIDKYGFIQAPYRKVENGKILDEVFYLSASEENQFVIAHYDLSVIDGDRLKDVLVHCRRNEDEYLANASEVDFIDLSPKQIMSISSSLIPFIENDDAHRAVMGSNMQRQALPLIKPTAALIGTGMEKVVVRDSGTCIKAEYDGTVVYLSANTITIENEDEMAPITTKYGLTKFDKSNDGTCIDQVPCVYIGQKIKAGDIIAIGAGIERDEVALGRNVKIAFQSWKGGNFEDAVLISSRIAKDFTSIGITKFDISIREIKHGVEQFTKDIPNINEELIMHLDESGIVRVGASLKSGDIMVGRITPKGESNMTPDERLLRAIFGHKSIDVKDTSLRVPPGMRGTVVDIRIFTRKGFQKSKRAIEVENTMINSYILEKKNEMDVLNNCFLKAARAFFPDSDKKSLSINFLLDADVKDRRYRNLIEKYRVQTSEIEKHFQDKCKEVFDGDTLPLGVLQTIHVFMATEYVIQPGDKVSGRHGNKGIISKVMSPEDMPFTSDGEPVDIILTSTGISGRMNIGQILETHLGWASFNLGKKINQFVEEVQRKENEIKKLRDFLLEIYDKRNEREFIISKSDEELIEFASSLKKGIPFACPVFEGPSRDRIKSLLELADCDPSGKEILYDGETGEPFPQKIAVGIMYIMQLHHLVEKKVHARSIGPYSMITQQPVGGKSQGGGQRLGEMEVYTLQAYSAAYMTREMLTVKSDYPIGRSRIFELISQGYDIFDQKGIPETFSVLIYELRALCLNVEALIFKDNRFVSQEISKCETFDALKISIADADQIRAWSYGEVKKPETIHYRTSKAHPDGIFSTKIFGPTKDWACQCGKHKGKKRKGIICSKCFTEVTTSKVRRTRMGHIELASPVAHVWFSRVLPSSISIMLDMSIINLNRILRLESYAVIVSGLSPYPVGSCISEQEYNEAMLHYEDTGFEALTGAESLESLLKSLDLNSEAHKMRLKLNGANESTRSKIIRRLKMMESFIRSGSKPESMVLRVIPVLPPDLRPLVALKDGDRFASSDMNDLYRRVINRNNRLTKLLQHSTPRIVIKNEQRMLQEAVDALFDNSRRTQPITSSMNKRPLKSLADIIKGKQGRFRQNLLGKRVDYSGRSVIVVGPDLKLHQCGIPKEMALELFKPHVISRLVLRGFARTPRIAKNKIENREEEIWEILAEVVKNHVVLMNRAPTLHRLGIQAFEVILIEGIAIQLHPLTCRAFNADFDGDQMAIHVPLSVEAQLEARLLMMSTKCIFNLSNGVPMSVPTKDMVLGLYAMTSIEKGFNKEPIFISSIDEAEHAMISGLIKYTSPVKFRVDGKFYDTTYGRVKFYSLVPKYDDLAFDSINKEMTSKEIQNLVFNVYVNVGEQKTVEFLDELMQYGFKHATLSGATFSYSDLPIPEEKYELVSKTSKLVEEYRQQFKEGLLREEDRYNKVIVAWSKCTELISQRLMNILSRQAEGLMMNPIYMMYISGARGSALQLTQLAGMRGPMVNADGSVQESPIINSFIEGMTVREYIGAARGARKGLSDTAVKTAKSGHLARILANTAQDCITEIFDCGATDGISLQSLTRAGIKMIDISTRVFGRTLLEDLYDDNNNLIANGGDIVDTNISQKIKNSSILSVKVRSPVHCKVKGPGICCKCYGFDFSNLKQVKEYVAVGIIAAQSIGEPGTQLTMKNFQSGGAVQNLLNDSRIVSIGSGTVSMLNVKVAEYDGQLIVTSKNNVINILNKRDEIISSHRIPSGAITKFRHGDLVNQEDLISEWDPYITSIVAEKSGTIKFKDLVADVSFNQVVDPNTGMMKSIVKSVTSRFSPALLLISGNSEIEYKLNPNDSIEVSNGDEVKAGQTLAQRTQSLIKTRDIISGLPLVVDIFEARIPKNCCVISEIDGIVSRSRSSSKLYVRSDSERREYSIPKNVNVMVEDGDYVKAGEFLTDGRPSMHDILKIRGVEEMSKYFIDEVQSVYQTQGILISDKHIEIVLRQMLGSGLIVDPGDTLMLQNDIVRVEELNSINQILEEENKQKVKFEIVLNGISRAAIIEKSSFFSAAAFQESARVLIRAAIANKIDFLFGMNENIISGQLIPSGVGAIIRRIKSESSNADANIKELQIESLKEMIA